MAIVLIEGFDHMTAAESATKGWNSNWSSMQTGRFDGQSAQINTNSLRQKVLPSTYSTLFVGFAFQTTNLSTTNAFFIIKAGATNTCQLFFDASGHLQIKNSGGTVIATGTTVLATNAWHYVELKFVVGTSGTIEVHLDGAAGEIASTVGNFGTTNVDTVGWSATASTSAATTVDDVYVADTTGSSPRNTFLGDVRVETVFPTGAGANTHWTPNGAGTNWGCVSETLADGDSTYISDSTPGDIDTYATGDVDANATIYGVQTNLYARKDDAATRQIAPVVRQSSTNNAGTTVTLSSAYAFYTQIYNQDPASADWTPSTFNGDEFGVKEVA